MQVQPGQDLNAVTQSSPAGTTFWLAPGKHTLGPDQFAQVVPKNGNVYVGAPGAVLDGRGVNRYAFTQQASGVQIRHLTIQGFISPPDEGVVNHDAGSGWIIERNTIRSNKGAAVMMGTGNVARWNCLADNGQYGISAYHPQGVANIVVDHNEIAGNNTDDWEARQPGCGCAGGTKFWNVEGAAITANWVHDNRGPGLWADTNNVGFRIEGNFIEGNTGEAIIYETSYNARIAGNRIRRNTIVKGQEFAARGDSFPIAAVYVSESGGDARLNGGVYATLEIVGNVLDDNWGGVVLWENADRFCGSVANTSTGYCPKGGSASLTSCVAGTIETAPYVNDCRWKTQNVAVHDNEFRLDKAAIGCAPGGPCGRQALLSNHGVTPPYAGLTVADNLTFHQNNHFEANHYVGDWRFNPLVVGNLQSFGVWRSAFGQDRNSTLVPALSPLAQYGVPSVPPPDLSLNALDADTATIEGSAGQWVSWFSSSTSRSAEQAQSGGHSLAVAVTAPFGWGVQLRNWPGFPTSGGPKLVSFAAMSPGPSALAVTMTVHWRNEAGADLATESVTVALTPQWQRTARVMVAPSGTVLVAIDFTHPVGGPGDVLFLDDIAVAQ